MTPELEAELRALAKSWNDYQACSWSYTPEEANQRERGYQGAADDLIAFIEARKK